MAGKVYSAQDIMKMAVGLIEPDVENADYDGDGKVTSSDVRSNDRIASGLSVAAPSAGNTGVVNAGNANKNTYAVSNAYQNQADAIYKRIQETPDFKYDFNEDAVFQALRNKYMKDGRIAEDYATQTACVLACHFGITDNMAETAKQLNELVTECGHLKTGFVGTPYLLHALSDNGYAKTAYDLLLREEYPGWLFSVKMGATTIWEHWDSMREDGSMWSTSMNSFNHYAYGSVADWLYGDAAGIKIDEKNPAFSHIIFAPLTDDRLDYVKASIESRFGAVKSEWKRENGKVSYFFAVPENCTATIILDGKKTEVTAGEYQF